MNSQELNNVFESFNPTEEQKQRMFANIMVQTSAVVKKTPVQMLKRICIPACSIAAAALVFAVLSGTLAPKNIVNDTYIVQNSDTDITAVREFKKEASDGIHTAEREPLRNKAASGSEKVPEESKAADNKDIVNNDRKFTASTHNSVAEPEIIPGDVASFAMNINTASVSLRACSAEAEVVSGSDAADDMAESNEQKAAFGGGGGSAFAVNESMTTITYDEFCGVVGIDIKDKLTLPDDMTDISDSERILSGEESVDEWNLVYQGKDNRVLTVSVSRDVGQNVQYFENSSFIKTDFNGTPGVVIFDGVSYTSYINKNNIAYVVNSNIKENELADLLLGMTAD